MAESKKPTSPAKKRAPRKAKSDDAPLDASSDVELTDAKSHDSADVQQPSPVTSAAKKPRKAKAKTQSAAPTATTPSAFHSKSPSGRVPVVPKRDLERLLAGDHSSPHSILGAHPASLADESGVIVRALVSNAIRGEVRLSDGRVFQLEREAEGLSDLYGAFISRRRHCRSTIAFASTMPTALSGIAPIRIGSCRRLATSICICSTKARIVSSGKSLAHTRARWMA